MVRCLLRRNQEDCTLPIHGDCSLSQAVSQDSRLTPPPPQSSLLMRVIPSQPPRPAFPKVSEKQTQSGRLLLR
ncbi:uncharacterized protein BP01DRAFT_36274 [Aspergillus saccharolyticus JOP 1030-1]|uniref:Uncharacterized protein n=1 Tax=Aspergillus saccharolyticus JOP 1030-1 TaxID=1450539 RepID=A0A318ZML3_9EURO|nr:hypothetical protein BP01DRAFT_36274 [Aspergillus saccharolyticus JOP 1030-1]PYH45673.1 hypothetical protein BP01DRAFT_36274 [Aspergillus saccharolyticus JOP 1030-1]